VVFDTDSVFHGVDRVGEEGGPIPALVPGMRLSWDGGRWRVGRADETLADYRWGEIRFSVSWKAYCYADEAERRRVHEHTDDLTRARAVDVLVGDLRERGRLRDPLPDRRTLALTIIDEYIRFPAPRPDGGAC
jgi:hypothetical protein